MKIIESSLNMFSNSLYSSQYEKKESLRLWINNNRLNFQGSSSSNPLSNFTQIKSINDIVNLSDQSKICSSKCNKSLDIVKLSSEDRIKILIIKAMIKALTGKDIKIKIPEINLETHEDIEIQHTGTQQLQEHLRWGIVYDYNESYNEVESMHFIAQGTVKIADGREISFNFELSIKREYFTEKNISFRAGDAINIDPLVISLENNTIELTDKKYKFDLNSDGKIDQISFLKSGSGFLALDLNGDSFINNGKELFGPNTGNGFTELAQYDEDGNGWIDESDSVFNCLLIWSKDESGNDMLSTLSDKKIAAIYLKNIATLFHLKNSNNKENGQIKSSSIYLAKDTTAGYIAQVDLTV